MMRLYFDTSIWLDLFENRDEPMIPKSSYVKELLRKIIRDNDRIIVSDLVFEELQGLGYSFFDIETLFKPLQPLLCNVEATPKQYGKAKDISQKRDVPFIDAVHALVARDYAATFITRDRHFQALCDIVRTAKPEALI